MLQCMCIVCLSFLKVRQHTNVKQLAVTYTQNKVLFSFALACRSKYSPDGPKYSFDRPKYLSIRPKYLSIRPKYSSDRPRLFIFVRRI